MKLIIEYHERETLICTYEKNLLNEYVYHIEQYEDEEDEYQKEIEGTIKYLFSYEEIYQIKRIKKADEHFIELIKNTNLEYKKIILYMLENTENEYTIIEKRNNVLCAITEVISNNEFYNIVKVKTIDFKNLKEQEYYGMLEYFYLDDYKTIFDVFNSIEELIEKEIKNQKYVIRDIEGYLSNTNDSQEEINKAKEVIRKCKDRIKYLKNFHMA